MSVQCVDLPNDCWELIFRSLDDYESLSLVCKRFYTLTNRLRSSLTILDPTVPYLPRLFIRFPALESLDLSSFHGDLNGVLRLISRSQLSLDSLNISNQKSLPLDGLQRLGSKMRNLRVLICSGIRFLRDSDLLVIAHSFPLLQELHIDFPINHPKFTVSDSGITALAKGLKHLRRVKIGTCFITDVSLLSMFQNCEFLREIALGDCSLISQQGIASAIRQRPYLTSFSLSNITTKWAIGLPYVIPEFIDSLVSLKELTSIKLSNFPISNELLCSIADAGLPLKRLILRKCSNYSFAGISRVFAKCQSIRYLDLHKADFLTDQDVKELSLLLPNVTFINLSFSPELTNSTFLTLTRNCPSLEEIRMEKTSLGDEGLENDSLIDCFTHPQVKRLYLGNNFKLKNRDVRRFASICPNLELLDVNTCWCITEGVFEALRDRPKIKHLTVAYCAALSRFEIGFEVPKLEVLNLSESRIGDEALSVVSKTCCGLTHLDLQNCFNVTAKGVRNVVEKCRSLRGINLKHCNKVSAEIIPWMVFSRSSLRKIMAPPSYRVSESQTELFLRHGCRVC